ncbi:MAG: hypothetical protein QNJ92_17395 [Alphaproteobacteria bacterium]|nr:hypothetical protein [Alphaproteobacteria bacterium]
MSTLSCTVYNSASEVALGEPLETLTVSIGATSDQTSAITTDGMARKRVRLFAQADCYIAYGENPTASSSTIPLGAENPEYFDIAAGHKVAVIERT